VLNQVPSVFRALEAAHRQAGHPPLGVRYLIFGGESVDLDVTRRFLDAAAHPARPVAVNMYGITETTVHATFKVLSEDDLEGDVRSPIGVPLGHLEIELRADGEAVPPGSPGEMWLTGPGVTAGYLNRPELDAERFVTLAGRRCYRSGDLARRLPNGELEYLGRIDQQVKLRGFRVELGEIEAVLRELDGVREAAAGVVTTDAGAQILVAYVVPTDSDSPPSSREMRAHSSATLPSHMVPSRYVVTDALTLTPSGKLDRAALPTLTRPLETADRGRL
jgi:nonribosomal peptide synthetase DhbF